MDPANIFQIRAKPMSVHQKRCLDLNLHLLSPAQSGGRSRPESGRNRSALVYCFPYEGPSGVGAVPCPVASFMATALSVYRPRHWERLYAPRTPWHLPYCAPRTWPRSLLILLASGFVLQGGREGKVRKIGFKQASGGDVSPGASKQVVRGSSFAFRFF